MQFTIKSMKEKDETPQLFGINTGEEIPEAYFYSHKAWDSYMGNLWGSLLRFMNIGIDEAVIEVAPGASVKIALALSAIGFRGRLYVVDRVQSVLLQVEQNYRQLLPYAKITFISKSLGQSLDELPRNPACVLSNHPLDDMILAAGAEIGQLNELFGWTCRDEESFSTLSKKIWDEIERSPQQLGKIKESVVNEWSDMLNVLHPRWCALSQYNSSVLQQSSMVTLNQHAAELLALLRARHAKPGVEHVQLQHLFNSHKNYNNIHIGREVLDAAHWLVFNNP